jgi:predicted dehydrogenase
LATSFASAQGLAKAAEKAGKHIACAPDTLLGGGYQTCRKILDEGWIGNPTSATACMMAAGPEDWHPNPGFYYQAGGGPLWDMGPYYLSALVFLLGPVKQVVGLGGRGKAERLIQSKPLAGTRVPVEVDTHFAALLEFVNGAVVSLTTSFDASGGSDLPNLEIYGTEGTLKAPDPNFFGGAISVRRRGQSEWGQIPPVNPLSANDRGAGLVEMAQALRAGRKPLASLELALHVTEILDALTEASAEKSFKKITTPCARPECLPLGWNPAHPTP